MPKLYNLTAQFDAADKAFATLKATVGSLGCLDVFDGASTIAVCYTANNAEPDQPSTEIMGFDIPAAVPSRKLQFNAGSNWLIVEEKGANVELSLFASGGFSRRQYLPDGSIEDGNGKQIGQDSFQTISRAVSALDSIPRFLIASL